MVNHLDEASLFLIYTRALSLVSIMLQEGSAKILTIPEPSMSQAHTMLQPK